MKLSGLTIILIFLSSWYSCSKSETKSEAAENVAPENFENEIINEIVIEKKDPIISSDINYRFGDGYGYRISFRDSDFGKKLAEEQAKLYSKSAEGSSEENIILTEKYGYDNMGREGLYDISKTYYEEALKAYKNNDLEQAIDNIETAIKTYAVGVYFYHYGVFLMDSHNYKNSEKAFFKALQFFGYTPPFL